MLNANNVDIVGNFVNPIDKHFSSDPTKFILHRPIILVNPIVMLKKIWFFGFHQVWFKTQLQEVFRYMSNLTKFNMPQIYTQASIIVDTTSLDFSRENGMRFEPCFKLFFKTLFENKFKFMVVPCGILELKSTWNLSCVKRSRYSWNFLCETKQHVVNKKILNLFFEI
jgi:hypothetical protein